MFVIAALMVGKVVGTKQISDNNTNVGQAHKADEILRKGFPQADPQTEIVLVQSSTRSVDDPTFRATVNDAIRTVAGNPEVKNLRSPLDKAHPDQVSSDRHAVMITWDMKGKYDHAKTKIDPIEAAIAKIGDRHPGFYVGEAG